MEGYCQRRLFDEPASSRKAAALVKPARRWHVTHTNVDGAGTIGYEATFDEARALADRLQADSDSRGNPWRFTYQVWHPNCIDRVAYRTHISREVAR